MPMPVQLILVNMNNTGLYDPVGRSITVLCLASSHVGWYGWRAEIISDWKNMVDRAG